jgi:hypothetical protein
VGADCGVHLHGRGVGTLGRGWLAGTWTESAKRKTIGLIPEQVFNRQLIGNINSLVPSSSPLIFFPPPLVIIVNSFLFIRFIRIHSRHTCSPRLRLIFRRKSPIMVLEQEAPH